MADVAEAAGVVVEEGKEVKECQEGDCSEVKEENTPEHLLELSNEARMADDLEKASDLISAALKSQVQKHGELSLECVDYYIAYGQILNEIEQSNQDVLGGDQEVPKLTAKASERVAAPTAESKEEEEEETEGKAESKSEEQAEETKSEQQAEETNVDQNPDAAKEAEASDLELAWDHMECARVILQRAIDQIEQGHGSSTQTGPTDVTTLRKKLCGVLISLGDIHVTQENYPEAQVQFLDALKLIEAHDPENWREKSSVCYYLGLTMKSQDAIEAAKYFTQAKEYLEAFYKTSEMKPDEEFLSNIAEKVWILLFILFTTYSQYIQIQECHELAAETEEVKNYIKKTIQDLFPQAQRDGEQNVEASVFKPESVEQANDIQSLVRIKRKREEEDSSSSKKMKVEEESSSK